MIDAEHRLVVDGLHVNHLRLVMGTSMGGMHVWMWGEAYPDMMDALMPLASLPAPIGGRNRVWRRMVSEAIRGDKEWANGDYQTQPSSLRTAIGMLFFVSDNPKRRTDAAPTDAAADKALDDYTDRALKVDDANDMLYAIESSYRLRSDEKPRSDPCAARGGQFSGRPDQPAGSRNHGARNKEGAAWPGGADPRRAGDARAWHAYGRQGLEVRLGAVAQGIGAEVGRPFFFQAQQARGRVRSLHVPTDRRRWR